MSRRFGPCMCGAIDCRSCGPAQGYSLGDDDEDPDMLEPDPPDHDDDGLEPERTEA